MKFNYENIPLTIASVQKYTSEFYPKSDELLIQNLIIKNKNELNTLIHFIKTDQEKPNLPNINIIRKNLKKKSKKFSINKNTSIGNLFTCGASEEDNNEQRILVFPYGNNINEPMAKITFRYYKRFKSMTRLFDKLIMALRTSKLDFNYVIKNKNNRNYIEFSTNTPIDNDKFWYILKIWSKN